MEPHVNDIARVIQLAVAPVFLLTAVATHINALNIRLGRAIDRRFADVPYDALAVRDVIGVPHQHGGVFKRRDGESFVISGLLLDEMRNSVTKVPWLGDIPILGALFRSSSYQKNQTELAVVVTPKIVNPIAAGQNIVLPGEKLASPSTFDALLLGELVDTTNPKVGTALLGTGGLEMP